MSGKDRVCLYRHEKRHKAGTGDHFVYKRDDIIERIVIQPKGNKAKAYQVKQVRNLFNKYGL